MPRLKGRCSACGKPLETEVAGAFAAAELAAPLCASCMTLQFLDSGGAILELRDQPEGARFPLGRVTITGGAIAALSAAGEHAASFLARHVRGDWGENGCFEQIELTEDEQRRGWEATDDPGKVNKWNLLNKRDTLLSAYTTSLNTRLWVITQLGGPAVTTVLLPEEY